LKLSDDFRPVARPSRPLAQRWADRLSGVGKCIRVVQQYGTSFMGTIAAPSVPAARWRPSSAQPCRARQRLRLRLRRRARGWRAPSDSGHFGARCREDVQLPSPRIAVQQDEKKPYATRQYQYGSA
jgi:hypothetical protein